MPIAFRRIVTGHREDGKSGFLFDSEARMTAEQVGRGLAFYELWETDGPLASNEGNEDAGARPFRHHPPIGGTKLRIVEFRPDGDHANGEVDAEFEEMEVVSQVEGAEDPSMHRNETVDYNIILSGEIYAVTEEGEQLLRPGDVIVQRGTAHTWRNKGKESCIFASVMVSAEALDCFRNNEDSDG